MNTRQLMAESAALRFVLFVNALMVIRYIVAYFQADNGVGRGFAIMGLIAGPALTFLAGALAGGLRWSIPVRPNFRPRDEWPYE